jgi:NhaP-type Na+/H+ or K+/H+ antiporter
MSEYVILALAAFIIVYALISKRLSTTIITGTILFVAFGLLIGPKGIDLMGADRNLTPIKVLFEATLVVVLFNDAMAINAKRWRKQAYIPGRLLGIGLPLTIVFGFAIALALFTELDVWEAALVGAILAPTDAALGQAVISNPRVPQNIRQGLNVESGLNDGIVLPVVMIFIAAAEESVGANTAFNALWFILETIFFSALIGIAVGWIGARLTSVASRRDWMSPIWRSIGVLALAALAYALSDSFGGSGFISAWVAGFTMGLVIRDEFPHIHVFPETVGQVLTMFSFIAFGALVLGPSLGDMTWEVVLYAVLSLTLVRMIPVAISMFRSGLRWPSVLYLGWFGPRGLASIIFALIIVEEASLPGAPLIILIMAITVGLSVLAHGVTSVWGANRYADWYEGKADIHEEMEESRKVPEIRIRIRNNPFGHRAKT